MHLEWPVEASNRTHCSAVPGCLWHPQCPHCVVFPLTDCICALLWCCDTAHPELAPWQIPSTLLSTVFSLRFLCWSINTCTLFFDAWLPVFACIQFSKKSACSVPVSCPSGSSHCLSLCYLPPVIFFGFGNQCTYLYSTWPKHSSYGTKPETHYFPFTLHFWGQSIRH